MESGHRKLDYGTPTDDDEVTIPPHDRATEVQNFPDTDIRDRQTLFDTQREDWLLQKEPLHGARPRQPGREHPPVIEDRPPLEATGGVDGRKPDQAPMLSPGRQILMEEEVITPPRGGRPTVKNQGLPPRGGRPAPEPQGSPRGVQAVPNFFTESRSRDSGLEYQKDIGSPVDILVDTVARMQQDLSRLREENRLLRTPAIPQVVQTPRRAAFTSTKVPRFDGTTSWEQYRVFDATVRSNGWDNDTAALQLFSHLEGGTLNVAHLVPLSRRLSRSGLVDALTAHYGSPIGRLP